MPDLALSSMYFQRWPAAADLAPFFEAGHAMGFAAFELSHILSPATVAALESGRERISVVHHPCPRPADFRDAHALTALAADDRARATAALAGSIASAARLGAAVVVLHLGRLEDDAAGSLARLRFEVDSRCLAGQTAIPPYAPALQALSDAVARAEPAHLERALAALAGPVELARSAGLRLGIETGYHADELPTPAGMRALLAASDPGVVGAWLDTGHVGAQQARGLASFDDWFAATSGRLLGAHYHDIVGLRDHLLPGMGSLDFAAIARRMPPDALATLEVDWYFQPAEVMAGAEQLRAALRAGEASQTA
jgi:sugar phosphate isomerase/epimerase